MDFQSHTAIVMHEATLRYLRPVLVQDFIAKRARLCAGAVEVISISPLAANVYSQFTTFLVSQYSVRPLIIVDFWLFLFDVFRISLRERTGLFKTSTSMHTYPGTTYPSFKRPFNMLVGLRISSTTRL